MVIYNKSHDRLLNSSLLPSFDKPSCVVVDNGLSARLPTRTPQIVDWNRTLDMKAICEHLLTVKNLCVLFSACAMPNLPICIYASTRVM